MPTIIPALPFTLTNGTVADANQVMGNFNTVLTGVNTNAAGTGPNGDITSLSGLTTPLSVPQGGTGQNTLGVANQLLTSNAGASFWQTGITGVTDGSNAPAGRVGEFMTVVGGPSAMPNSSPVSIGTLVLSPGDWDVWALGTMTPTVGASFMAAAMGLILNSFAGASPAQFSSTTSGLSACALVTPTVRFNVTVTTDVFCTMQANFSTGAVTGGSSLFARRVR
jgi:hypothetical protein